MMSLTVGQFTQVSGSGPLGPLVCNCFGGETPHLTTKDIQYLSLFWISRLSVCLWGLASNWQHVPSVFFINPTHCVLSWKKIVGRGIRVPRRK